MQRTTRDDDARPSAKKRTRRRRFPIEVLSPDEVRALLDACSTTPIGIISKQLGHRSIATTARYLDHIAPFAVVDAMREREW